MPSFTGYRVAIFVHLLPVFLGLQQNVVVCVCVCVCVFSFSFFVAAFAAGVSMAGQKIIWQFNLRAARFVPGRI